MKLLAVDTSGPVCGVAILTEDGIRHECAVMNHKTHSVNLLPMIDNAFQSTGLTIQDMDRLAVVVGPGSFTGVRLGVSTVKGLAHGAGKRSTRWKQWRRASADSAVSSARFRMRALGRCTAQRSPREKIARIG